MSSATDHFEAELEALIRRFRFEYDLSYAVAVGCLALAAQRLMQEAESSE